MRMHASLFVSSEDRITVSEQGTVSVDPVGSGHFAIHVDDPADAYRMAAAFEGLALRMRANAMLPESLDREQEAVTS